MDIIEFKNGLEFVVGQINFQHSKDEVVSIMEDEYGAIIIFERVRTDNSRYIQHFNPDGRSINNIIINI
jgi:uncharacterized protein YkvS